ncbi:MAG TPA: hypothetical protein ENN31_00845 [Candidatus Vogelbacteria bacterium]|nr:hypothetical protein [Candidatus Vogelbacteria bacterium]
MEENKENIKTSEEARRYELGYLITPLLPAEKVSSELTEKVILPLEKLGCMIINQQTPTMMNLAYILYKTIEHKRDKYKQAYFGNIIFSVKPENISKVKDIIDKSGLFLRYLLIIAPTVSTKTGSRSMIKSIRPIKKDSGKDKEVPVVVKEEEIDKEIEGLLTDI